MLARVLAALTGLLLLPTMVAVTPAEAARRPAPIQSSLSDVPQGGFTLITGRVARGPRPVRVQQRIPVRQMGRAWVKWLPVSGEFSKRNGRFTIRLDAPSQVGTYTYRAWAPRWHGRRAWTSAPISIRVTRVGVNPDTVATTIPVTSAASPASVTRPLDWGRTDTFTARPGVTSASCVTPDFCAVGDNSGRVYFDTQSPTIATAQLSSAPIVGVSCTSTNFCMALDRAGKAYRYNGSTWWGPVSINQGHTSTDVACASANLCVAVDQEGYGVPYVNGTWWSRQAGTVEGTPAVGGFQDASCGIGAIACALTSPAGITLFVFSDNPSGPSPSFTRQFTPWSPETDRPVRRGSLTGVSCPTTDSCLVAHTEGQATFIDPDGFLGILPDFKTFDYRPG
ncbi:MAG TPA: hypothetical protein PLC19_02105, partial [Marmoricola sp.]|nr:hypothetical protein [Marmoricola sp.]